MVQDCMIKIDLSRDLFEFCGIKFILKDNVRWDKQTIYTDKS